MDEREERIQRLKRLKRKRMLTVGVLCVLLVGLIGGYYALHQHNEKKAAEEARKEEERQALADTEVQITEFALTEVAAIEFTNPEASYHYVWTDMEPTGTWVKQDEKDFPTNIQKVQSIIGTFCEMTGSNRIAAENADLSLYGLDDTAYSAKITLREGGEHSFKVGNEAPYSSGYYMLYENTGDVYVVNKLAYTRLNTEKIDMVQGETFPSAEPESMMELRIEVRDGETISYVPEENEDGSLTYPPIFYDSMRFVASTIEEYNCTDFAKYGLDDPYVTVTIDYLGYSFTDEGMLQREPMTMKLEIGDKTVSDNYFVRVNDSNFVYIMVDLQAKKYLPQ